jgi:stage V sporulation protein S
LAQIERIRVASSTPNQGLAGSIAKVIGNGYECELTAIGAGAVNQAVKGLVIARRMVSSSGYDLLFAPGFTTLNLEDVGGKSEITAIVFRTVLR